MRKFLGRARNPREGAAKYVAAVTDRISHDGEVIGAPERKRLGPFTDQLPMNEAFTDPSPINEFWTTVEEVVGIVAAWPPAHRDRPLTASRAGSFAGTG